MAFPIVHSLIGYSVYRAGRPQKKSWRKAVFFGFLASAADFDYIPGVLVGKPLLFHGSITHSLAAALFCGLTVALLAKFFTKYTFTKTFLLSFAVYLTHPLIDMVTSGTGAPFFWPFQSAHLAEQIQTFRSLSIECSGIKSFACGVFANAHYVQRFWREICCLCGALIFFFSLPFLRRFLPSKRPTTVLTPNDVAA